MRKHVQSLPRCLTRKSVIVASLFIAAVIVVGPHFDKDVAVGLIALKPWSSEVCVMGLEQKRRLASTIADVRREIHRLSGTKGFVDAKWAVKLAGIIEELDPRVTVDNGPRQKEALPPSAGGTSTLPKAKRHVCPEIIRKYRYDVPYCQLGVDLENCDYVPKFRDVLTAVLPARSWEPLVTNIVIEGIRSNYDIPIIIIAPPGEKLYPTFKGVTVITANKDIEDSDVMNDAVNRVKTPFIFLGLSLTNFNNQSSLERLVRVLDELDQTVVASGASRDLHGRWNHGCLQGRMADYQAHYAAGYYYSKYDCMFCDDVLNPCVIRTELLNKKPFTKGLNGQVVFRDWFATIRVLGYLALSCPDVMFYTTGPVKMNEKDWLVMAKQWKLEQIQSYDGQVFSFPCESVGISCFFPLHTVFSYLLPPCCRAMMDKLTGNIVRFAKRNNVRYQLTWGSALGAVKMGSRIPWDFDTDIWYDCGDFDKWQTFPDTPEGKGCSLTVFDRTYFSIHCQGYFVDMGCYETKIDRLEFLPRGYQNIPTTINHSGHDLIVPPNPGLFVRNCIGLGDLKHKAHWRTKKIVDLTSKKDDAHYNPSPWNYCNDPSHHSCLMQFPTDGNLPFTDPFLHV